MVRRKNIGLFFVFDNATNSGIVNYLFSFVKALNTLDNVNKPELTIFHSESAPIEMIKAENYPYISFKQVIGPQVSRNLVSRIINKVARIMTNKNWIYVNKITSQDADYLFPFPLNSHFNAIKGKVHWLVDFNPYYFPNHLSEEQRKQYFEHAKQVVYKKDKVVLSSFNVLKDLKKFYPDYTCKVEILRFAALLQPFNHVNLNSVKSKFDITRPFVMTPNQFWVHKNHILMLKAAALLKKRGATFQMIFTGSTKVESESNYYPLLLDFVSQNGLQNEVRFLGIVDRSEQLMLMKNAEALVQPSLFEGWSTLVEESKALNKHIVLSDLAIHKEQIDFNCSFFDPLNENQLADILEAIFRNGVEVSFYDYTIDIKNYARKILEIFN